MNEETPVNGESPKQNRDNTGHTGGRATSPRRDNAGRNAGDRKPWDKSDRAKNPKGTERKPWEKRSGSSNTGERKPWEKRSGDQGTRHTDRSGKPGDEKKLWTRDGKPARGDREAPRYEAELTEEQKLARELKPVRPRHYAPEIDEDVQPNQLDRVARNELKTLSKENADEVAKHLVMVTRLIDEAPELAHQHAISAGRRAGRIAVVRETLAITAYSTEDYALALRELRTYRRISGSDDELPLMVDSERGLGRPDRALELGRSVDRSTLPNDVQASLAIAMSGARLDQSNVDAALAELEIPQLDPNRAFTYSADLFNAYAEVLEELGRTDEADKWRKRARVADDAVQGASGDLESETIEIVEEEPSPEDVGPDEQDDNGAIPHED